MNDKERNLDETRKCEGFDPYPNCENLPNKNSLWCDRCDALRRAHITRRFQELDALFKERIKEREDEKWKPQRVLGITWVRLVLFAVWLGLF